MDDVLLYVACNASIIEQTAEMHKNEDNHFKIFIWGGISSGICSEIIFYGSARALP